MGRLVKMKTELSTVYGMISRLWLADPGSSLQTAQRMLEIEIFGESLNTSSSDQHPSFQRGVSIYPDLGDDIFAVTPEDVAIVYAKPRESNVAIGVIHQDLRQPAFLITDGLLGKHFAVLGTTGSGKSCAVALILHATLAEHPCGHVVLLDPHNEYATSFGDTAEILTTGNLVLPYWLMNFEEAVATFISSDSPDRDSEARILKEAILLARQEYHGVEDDADHITIDSPLPYLIKDVQRVIDRGMGRLEKPEGATPYLRLLARIEALRSDRRFAFMFPENVIKDTMPELLSRIGRIPVSGRPITIIDLSGVPSEIVDVVVSVMCRTIFDFAVWSVPPKQVPILLVCEEAHRYVPRDESLGFGPTRRAISRIAKEGRKYGVSLCLVSQRPSELSETILSQCNTIIALRMSNRYDQEFVSRTLPDGASGLVRALPALRTQEAIVVGEGVTVPMRLRFRDLEASRRPRSATAAFSAAWQDEIEWQTFIRDTLDHWRRSQ
jgi:DNA helicase HerA-like ATPase